MKTSAKHIRIRLLPEGGCVNEAMTGPRDNGFSGPAVAHDEPVFGQTVIQCLCKRVASAICQFIADGEDTLMLRRTASVVVNDKKLDLTEHIHRYWTDTTVT